MAQDTRARTTGETETSDAMAEAVVVLDELHDIDPAGFDWLMATMAGVEGPGWWPLAGRVAGLLIEVARLRAGPRERAGAGLDAIAEDDPRGHLAAAAALEVLAVAGRAPAGPVSFGVQEESVGQFVRIVDLAARHALGRMVGLDAGEAASSAIWGRDVAEVAS